MAKGRSGRWRAAALFLALGAAALAGAPDARAQVAVGTAGESPADALARNMKTLGSKPRDFEALVGAGRASLALGDTQAAAGFFGRADEVWPASPLPQAGMGAAMAQEGDGATALQFFARAAQRGATQSMIGADRGLAYDLLGQHSQAQADYRAALLGRDRDEARRRLALSLAITGKKGEALSMLSPLMARGDAGGARCRAFVLALSGDIAAAKAAIDAAMPGSSAHMAYFFQKLPGLRSDQKAAAVNLGIFPGNGVQVASAAPSGAATAYAGTPPRASDEDRIGEIERWLSQGRAKAAAGPQARPSAAQPAQRLASVSLPPAPAIRQAANGSTGAAIYGTSKLWLQLASGSSAAALPGEFRRMKARNPDLFEGISGFVFDQGGRARLLIGPFRNSQEAGIFADDLQTVHIDAFQWTSQPGQTLTKLSSE
jgi:Flp pilus assembly protein TadD